MQSGTEQDRLTLETIERAVARNLLDYVQALNMVAPGLAGAATPCAGGTAAFVGAGCPLTTIKGAGPVVTDDDIEHAEEWFRRHGVNAVVFELAPWISGETADRLLRRGYEVTGSENVVVRRSPFDAPQPLHPVKRVDTGNWPEIMLQVNDAADSPLWRGLVQACASLPDAMHFAIPGTSGGWIGCAQVLPAAGIALFANDATHPTARGHGAQTAIIHERLRAIAKLPFFCLAAEVAPGSTSERNYLRCAFRVFYARAHYSRRIA